MCRVETGSDAYIEVALASAFPEERQQNFARRAPPSVAIGKPEHPPVVQLKDNRRVNGRTAVGFEGVMLATLGNEKNGSRAVRQK